MAVSTKRTRTTRPANVICEAFHPGSLLGIFSIQGSRSPLLSFLSDIGNPKYVVGVGGATFGHRPKARAQLECHDKVFCRLGRPSEERRRPRRQRRRRSRAKRGEDQSAKGEDEAERREAKTKAPKAKTKASEARRRPMRRLQSRRPAKEGVGERALQKPRRDHVRRTMMCEPGPDGL